MARILLEETEEKDVYLCTNTGEYIINYKNESYNIKPKTMKKAIKEFIEDVLLVIVSVFVIWLITTTTIQAYHCPELTQTELFLNMPNSIILNLKSC